MISIKNKDEISLMTEAGRIVKDTLFLLENHIENNGMIIFSSHFNPEIKNTDTINIENYANF